MKVGNHLTNETCGRSNASEPASWAWDVLSLVVDVLSSLLDVLFALLL